MCAKAFRHVGMGTAVILSHLRTAWIQIWRCPQPGHVGGSAKPGLYSCHSNHRHSSLHIASRDLTIRSDPIYWCCRCSCEVVVGIMAEVAVTGIWLKELHSQGSRDLHQSSKDPIQRPSFLHCGVATLLIIWPSVPRAPPRPIWPSPGCHPISYCLPSILTIPLSPLPSPAARSSELVLHWSHLGCSGPSEAPVTNCYIGQLDRTAQDTVFLHGVALVLAQRPWATTVAEGSEDLLHPWSVVSLVNTGNISQPDFWVV